MLLPALNTTKEAYIFAFRALRPSGLFLTLYLASVLFTVLLLTTIFIGKAFSLNDIVFSAGVIVALYVISCAYQAKLYVLALGQTDRQILVSDIRIIAIASLFVIFLFLLFLSIFIVYLLVWPSTVLSLLCGNGSFICSSETEDVHRALSILMMQPAGILVWIPTLLILSGFVVLVLKLSKFGVATIALNRITVLSSIGFTKRTWGRIGLTVVFTYLIPTLLFMPLFVVSLQTSHEFWSIPTLLQLLAILVYAPIVNGTSIYTVTKYFLEVMPEYRSSSNASAI